MKWLNFHKTAFLNTKNLILLGFILFKFLLQYHLVSPSYDLHRDEYLHLDQANHLAWGFLSVPPVSSWISLIIQSLGNTVFWVRFFPALFGALTIFVVWKAIEALKGNLFALILGATCVLFSALLRLNILFQPNSLDVLCWTSMYFVLIKYFETEKKTYFFVAAFVFAIGFLNKYNFVFLLTGLFPALVMTGHRKILLKKEFFLAAVVGILLILPNLIWQYNHNFPVFHHLKALEKTQLVHVNRLDFLKGQVLFFINAVIVLLASFYALVFYTPFKKHRIFLWSIIFTLAVFVFLKAKDYYAIGIYPIYIAFGSVYLEKILNGGKKKNLKLVLLAIPILIFIPIYQIAFPNKSPKEIFENSQNYKKVGLLRWEDGKDHALPQDFADMLAWKELAGKVDKICEKLPPNEHFIVVCDNYGQAGAINFYSKKSISAVSFSTDYMNWFDLQMPIQHFIRIKEAGNIEEELAETSPFFESAVVADSITNQFAREYQTSIFLFSKPKIDINEKLQLEVDKAKILD